MNRRDQRNPYPFHTDQRPRGETVKAHRVVRKPTRWQRFIAWLRQP